MSPTVLKRRRRKALARWHRDSPLGWLSAFKRAEKRLDGFEQKWVTFYHHGPHGTATVTGEKSRDGLMWR